MNADGVVIFYGATDQDTSLAEMRPPLGGDSAVITLRTTKTLRMLDFKRLQTAYGGEPLSYFQPDFTEQVEKKRIPSAATQTDIATRHTGARV